MLYYVYHWPQLCGQPYKANKMEININQYFENELCARDFSASVAEIGNNAGQLTWGYALDEVEDVVLLTTFEQCAAFIEHMTSMGMDNVDKMNGTELNALFIQLISGDIRESEGLSECPINWELYEQESEAGDISSRIYFGTDNNYYYYLGE
jgi:hypothetical protein